MKVLFFGLIAIGMLLIPAAVSAQAQNCDSNAVIYCGVTSAQDLINKTNNGDGVNSALGIQQAMNGQNIDVNAAATSAVVDGTVDNQGNVMVNGQVVATGAQSIGRNFLPGSTITGVLWMRPTSVSFAQPQLDAFVDMADGTFHWAIIKSCGNPVVANAVPQAVPQTVTPAPAPEVPTAAPVEVTPAPVLPQTGSHENHYPAALAGTSLISIGLFALVRSRQQLLAALLK